MSTEALAAVGHSCLYTGTVMHRRLKPHAHRLNYRAFWCLLDLDELPDLSARLTFFSLERFNLFGFRTTDHGDGSNRPLRAQVDAHLATAGIDLKGGAIRLLCMPRFLGFVFNPISVYYCYDRSGALRALLYQVHNTFRQRHSYLIPVDSRPGEPIEQRCLKAFYVSPFMDMDIAYRFRVQPPDERVALVIECSDADGPVLIASLAGERQALTDTALLRVFLSFPLMTLKVVAGIHWEALKLWIKGMRLRPRPPAPSPITIATQPLPNTSQAFGNSHD
ncbi:DUF1365 domain-containing protein [Undibacter mobilis]|uniref:DUF1365 domain-containing protein n=1 Tax=Undibacter mobilis TaxID=2292256 RepID=A0A371B7U4_9BRAD|nr:DUF1365 family protein [Undibacter mobilis]RDV03592.1 DUF1365 domain-containing protein [Undibacter mobilis]